MTRVKKPLLARICNLFQPSDTGISESTEPKEFIFFNPNKWIIHPQHGEIRNQSATKTPARKDMFMLAIKQEITGSLSFITDNMQTLKRAQYNGD